MDGLDPGRQTAWFQGPLKKYPMLAGEEYIKNAINRNFAALKAKKEELAGIATGGRVVQVDA